MMSRHGAAGVSGSETALAAPGPLAAPRLHSGTAKRVVPPAEGDSASLLSRPAASWPAMSEGDAGTHPEPDLGSESCGRFTLAAPGGGAAEPPRGWTRFSEQF